jgi:hypothetical protein
MSARQFSWMTGLTVLLNSAIATAEPQNAAGTAGTTSSFGSSVVLESLALILVFACILVTFRLYRAIRGGKLSRGWMWFLFGFTVLGASQLMLFGGHIGVVPTWNGGIWVDVLRVFSVVLLLVGVTRFRKLLA